ncbi:MAG TPA: TrkH family potassium uptake protein [Thermoanaerobaculia bacterium]
MNLLATLRFLGRLLLVLALAESFPVAVCWFYGEQEALVDFLATAAATGLCGLLLIRVGGAGGELYRREGIVIVVAGWILASLFGAVPYFLSGEVGLVDALFESASGFTTTGASILTDIESAPRGLLFWRSFTQWLGGMGIIVLFVALLPELGPGARFLYKLEVPGPTAETLHPRVHDTAAVLWKTYLYLSLAQVLLLLAAGLDLYDAMTHTFSTLSTGGFSPRGASIAAFGSPLVEVIVVVFMVIAGANFSLYFAILRHRGRNLVRDPEFRLYVAMIAAASGLVTWNLMTRGGYELLPRAFLDALFQVASILTTTGFATADYDRWPSLSRLLLVGLMFIGGCAGSTAGGLKVMRLVIGLKSALREVRLMYSPSTVLRIFVGGKAVPDAVVKSVAGFFILYFVSWALGTLFLTMGGIDLETSASAAIATLGNIGPGLARVGPAQNFAFWSDAQKLLMVLLMWLGRLEVYAIAALVTASFWRR